MSEVESRLRRYEKDGSRCVAVRESSRIIEKTDDGVLYISLQLPAGDVKELHLHESQIEELEAVLDAEVEQ